jgi:hypothetical protein
MQFMAWERSFERRVLKIRDRELFYQWRNYVIEVISQLTVWFLLLTLPSDSLQRDLATLSDPHHRNCILALCSHPWQASYTCHCLHLCTRLNTNPCLFSHLLPLPPVECLHGDEICPRRTSRDVHQYPSIHRLDEAYLQVP